MRIDVITLFPAMVTEAVSYGVTGRALKNELLQLALWNPRDFTENVHRTVDDRPYGGGPGMLLKAEPLELALSAAKKATDSESLVVYLSPQGRMLNQEAIKRFAQMPRLILVSGRYEGIDERFVQRCVDEEWSIGDYVVSGGELPALLMIDAIGRMLPGVLGHEDSARLDSHMDGLLDYPHYTRPEHWQGQQVPSVLLNGNHEQIRRWRLKQSLGHTWLKRPEMLSAIELNDEQKQLLNEFKLEQN